MAANTSICRAKSFCSSGVSESQEGISCVRLVSFVPGGRPGIYMELGAAQRLEQGMSWATIQGDTLSIREMAVLDDGSYSVQTYHRSLTKEGMFLHFISDRDGQSIRTVTARLIKD